MNSNSTETWQIKKTADSAILRRRNTLLFGGSCNPTPNVRFTSWSIFNDGDLLHSLVSLPLRQSAYNLFTGVVMLECGHYVEESLSPSVPPLVIVSRVADHKSPRAEGEKSKTFANREMVALGVETGSHQQMFDLFHCDNRPTCWTKRDQTPLPSGVDCCSTGQVTREWIMHGVT